jgi:hypothetical protein
VRPIYQSTSFRDLPVPAKFVRGSNMILILLNSSYNCMFKYL